MDNLNDKLPFEYETQPSCLGAVSRGRCYGRTHEKMEEFKWELPKIKERPVGDGDLRIVNLPVQVVFEWSDKIISDYDSETNTILEYTSGYVMKVLPNQSFIFNNEESIFIASVLKEQ